MSRGQVGGDGSASKQENKKGKTQRGIGEY